MLEIDRMPHAMQGNHPDKMMQFLPEGFCFFRLQGPQCCSPCQCRFLTNAGWTLVAKCHEVFNNSSVPQHFGPQNAACPCHDAGTGSMPVKPLVFRHILGDEHLYDMHLNPSFFFTQTHLVSAPEEEGGVQSGAGS